MDTKDKETLESLSGRANNELLSTKFSWEGSVVLRNFIKEAYNLGASDLASKAKTEIERYAKADKNDSPDSYMAFEMSQNIIDNSLNEINK